MPSQLKDIGIMSTSQIDEAYEIGYKEALSKIDDIMRVLAY